MTDTPARRRLKLLNVLVASTILAGAIAQPPAQRAAGTIIEFRAAQ